MVRGESLSYCDPVRAPFFAKRINDAKHWLLLGAERSAKLPLQGLCQQDLLGPNSSKPARRVPGPSAESREEAAVSHSLALTQCPYPVSSAQLGLGMMVFSLRVLSAFIAERGLVVRTGFLLWRLYVR